jgi:hypothetical protein
MSQHNKPKYNAVLVSTLDENQRTELLQQYDGNTPQDKLVMYGDALELLHYKLVIERAEDDDEPELEDDVRVTCTVRSDCGNKTVELDCTEYFKGAEFTTLVELADEDWGGDYAADGVLDYMAYVVKDPMALDFFAYLEHIPKLPHSDDPNGFAVYVNIKEAYAWLRANHPDWLSGIRSESNFSDETI